jgi:hypothetical protein
MLLGAACQDAQHTHTHTSPSWRWHTFIALHCISNQHQRWPALAWPLALPLLLLLLPAGWWQAVTKSVLQSRECI